MESKQSPVKQYYVAVGTPEMKLSTLVDLLLALQANGPLGLAVVCSQRDSLDEVIRGLKKLRGTVVHRLHANLTDEQREAVVAGFCAATAPEQPPTLPSRGESNAGSRHSSSGQELAQPADVGTAEGSGRVAGTIGGVEFDEWGFELSTSPPETVHVGSADDRASQGPTAQLEPQQPAPSSDPLDGAPETPEPSGEAPPPRPRAHVLATTDACLRAVEGVHSLGVPLLINYDLPTRKEVSMRRNAVVLGSRDHRELPYRIAVYFFVGIEVADFRAVEGFAGGYIEGMPVHVSDIFADKGRLMKVR